MALIEWSSQLSVGFEEMDDDHKKLVGIVNTLNDAVADGCSDEDIEDILEELLSYTNWHFRHEERLMQEFEYPEYDAHKEEHSDLVQQASELFKKFQNGDKSVPELLLPFLKEWLANHILGTDMKTGNFLAANA
ncbi:MAG: bacteriohemerythrin [Desulfovibrio sp.]